MRHRQSPHVSRSPRGVVLVVAASASACAGFPDKAPETSVVIENDYAASASLPPLVYEAYWLNVAFQTPISPGTSSAPEDAIPTSGNTAYVLLAPGWDPTSTSAPTSLIAMQSRADFGVALGDTLQIPVNDTTFEGNCAAGSHLTQQQADFLTELVFASAFVGVHYDASTCTTTPNGDAGAP
jgi:hypothetical protein